METVFLIGIFILVILIIGILSLFSFQKKDIEHFLNNNNTKIQFLNKDEVNDLLKTDEDGYFNSFTIYDLKVRDVRDKEEYLNKVLNSTRDISTNDKERLIKLTKEADEKIKQINYEWFNGIKCADIKWIFGQTKGKIYENGLPHTRVNIIMLGDDTLKQNDESLINTLIHEKVHLYQKRYPIDLEKYKEVNGFTRVRRRDVNDKIRANPDTDEYIYRDSKGKEMMTIYNDNATGLEDTKTQPENNQSSEHPNEAMAIKIEDLF